MISDIARAEKHLEDMANAKQLDEYQMSWQDFLFRLERIWELTKVRYFKRSWYSKFNGPYAKLRKKDPLLRYLKQARNAETHTIEGTLDSPFNIVFKEKYGRPFEVNEIKTTLIDGVLTIDVKSPDLLYEYEADFYRKTPSLTRFKCRKDWYNPPSHHLGNRVGSKCPVVVGKLGLEFCRAYVGELEKYENET